MENASPDLVNHPPHYRAHPSGIECIAITERLSFCLGNAVKYVWRRKEKGTEIQDLEKALWYLDRERALVIALGSERPPVAYDPRYVKICAGVSADGSDQLLAEVVQRLWWDIATPRSVVLTLDSMIMSVTRELDRLKARLPAPTL